MSDLDSNEKISLHLCKVLDMMGYSRQMIQFRRQAYQEYVALLNINHDVETVIISGSKGEGLTSVFQSDIDIIYLYKDVIATELGWIHVAPPTSSIFTFRPDYLHPGNNILTLNRLGPRVPETIESSLQPTPTGLQVLSSNVHAEYCEAMIRRTTNPAEIHHGRSGPACSSTLFNLDFDKVYSIPSVSHTLFMQWSQRLREYDWPSEALRLQIAEMGGNFVAKGCKYSLNEKHEWRQCFNEAELLLVHSFEECRTKLYVLLKIILKEVLRPLDTEQSLTSYVMKNIVFWLAEQNPSYSFQPKYLIKCLITALRMLEESLLEMSLPYYMLPERNLFHPGIATKVRDNLVHRVQCLIREGPRMLYRCEKLEYTTKMSHSELSEFGAQRDELEMMFLQLLNYHSRMETQGLSTEQKDSDETLRTMNRRLYELVFSRWPHHIQGGLDKCSDNIWDRMAVLLG